MNTIDETQQAIDFAGAFATPLWGDEASAAVSVLCRIGNDFTTDDVWKLLIETGQTTPEPRALGSIMQTAAKDGLIRKAGYYRPSARRECHNRPLQVWRPIGTRVREYADGD